MAGPLKIGEALQKARQLLQYGRFTVTSHLRQRMNEREFYLRDIVHVFKNGQINRPPVWDKERRQWRYVVDGSTVDDASLSVVFAFEDDVLVLITGYDGRKSV